MSVVIKTIKDYFNNYVYPKTKTKAVYDDSNNRLDTTLSTVVHFDNDSSSGTISDPVLKQSDIATTLGTSDTNPASQKLVNTVNTNLGSPSSASSVTGADAFSKISTLNSDLTFVNDTVTLAHLQKVTGYEIANAAALKQALAGTIFTPGTNIVSYYGSASGYKDHGTLVMQALNNQYGIGIFFGYYINSDRIYIVRNLNRTFTVYAVTGTEQT